MVLPIRPKPCNRHKPRIRIAIGAASRSDAKRDRLPVVQPAADRLDRINVFVGGHWSHLTVAQAEAAHAQLGESIAAVKARMESVA